MKAIFIDFFSYSSYIILIILTNDSINIAIVFNHVSVQKQVVLGRDKRTYRHMKLISRMQMFQQSSEVFAFVIAEGSSNNR